MEEGALNSSLCLVICLTRGRFLMCLAIHTFTDKIIFQCCLLLNRPTREFVFPPNTSPLGNREGCDCYVLTISFPAPIC